MDEIDNDSLSLILIFDDKLFPKLLDYSLSNGWSDLIIFLLEADHLRFKSTGDLNLDFNQESIGMYAPYHLLSKDYKLCSDDVNDVNDNNSDNYCFTKFINKNKLTSLSRLVTSELPFHCIYSQLCDSIWKDVLQRTNEIINSPVWYTSIRQTLVDGYHADIDDVLNDPIKRKYFERHAQIDPNNLTSLHCLLNIRRVLNNLQPYKIMPYKVDNNNHHTILTTISNNNKIASIDEKKVSSSFSHLRRLSSSRNWRGSKYASKTLHLSPLGLSSSSSSSMNYSKELNSSSSNNINNNINNYSGTGKSMDDSTSEYNDPYEACRILLEGLRSIQKYFFPTGSVSNNMYTSSSTVSISTSAGNIHTMDGFLYPSSNFAALDDHSFIDRERSASTSSSAFAQNISSSGYQSSSSSSFIQSKRRSTLSSFSNSIPAASMYKSCAGLSESLRIEIQSILTANSSIRTREIESIDRSYAYTCSTMLERLLSCLEVEMMTTVKQMFHDFNQSNEYATMIAHSRGLVNDRITSYYNNLSFLYDRVRQQRVVSWQDTFARGKLYISYDRLLDYDDDGGYDDDDDNGEKKEEGHISSGVEHVRNLSDGMSNKTPFSSNISEVDGSDDSDDNNTNINNISINNISSFEMNMSPLDSSSKQSSLSPDTSKQRSMNTNMINTYDDGNHLHHSADRNDDDDDDDDDDNIRRNISGKSDARQSIDSDRKDNRRSANGDASSHHHHHHQDMKIVTIGVELVIPRTVTLTSRNAYKYCNRAVLYGNSSASSSLHNKLFSHNPINNNNNNNNNNRNTINDNNNRNNNNNNNNRNNINDNNNRNNINNNNNNNNNNNRDNMKLSGATEDNGILDLSSISAFSEPLSSPDNHHHHHHHSFSGSNTASRRKKLTSFAVHVDDDDDKYDEETKTSLKDIDDDSSPLLNHPNKTACTNLNKPQSSPSSSSSHPYLSSTLLSLDLNAIDQVIYSHILSDKDNNRDDKRAHHHHHHQQQQQQQQHQDTSFNLTSPSINTQHLLCSLSVALASSSCNHDLGNKFIAPVQEIMNFITDAKGLSLLHDIIYADIPKVYGITRERAYLRAFECLSSISSSSSSSSPLYSVCVSIISSIITKKDAMKVKKRSSATVLSTTMNTKRVVRGSNNDRFFYNHIRFGVSYSIVSNKHTMVNLLQNLSYKTCKLLKLLSVSSSASSSTTMSPQRRLSGNGSEIKRGGVGGGMLDSHSLSSSLLVDSNNGLVLSCEDYFTSSSLSSSNNVVYDDNNDRNSNNNNNDCRQSDANVECLFDIYFIPQSNESTIGVNSIKVQDTLSEVINKHLGLCDFSMSTIVSSLSTRLLLQILMLVLVDKPIILLSSSCTLLTKVQHLIPRIIWPFRINTTHVMKQILNQSDLARFVIGNSGDNHDNKKNKNRNVNNPYYLSSKHDKRTQNVGKKSNWREMINQFASNVGSYLSTPKWGSVKYSKNANRSLSEITILKKSKRKSSHISNRSNNNYNSNSGGGNNSSNISCHADRQVIYDDNNDDMISNKFNNSYDVSIDNDESKRSPSNDVNNSTKNDGENRNRVVCFSPDVTIDTDINDDYDSQSDDDYVYDDDDHIDEDSDDENGNADKFLNDLSHHKRSNGTVSSSSDKVEKSCVVGIESTVFYGASKELRLDLEEMRIKGFAFTIIDIDSGTLWNQRPTYAQARTSDNDNKPAPKTLPSRLSDDELFKTGNFHIFRSLIKSINEVHSVFLEEVNSIQNERQQLYDQYNNTTVTAKAAVANNQKRFILQQYAKITMITNIEIERIFYVFWSEFILRAIPRNIQHFSGPKVITCNIRGVLSELLLTVAITSVNNAYIRDDYIDDVFHSMSKMKSGNQNNRLPTTSNMTSTATLTAATANVEQYNNHESSYISKVNRKLYESLHDMTFEEFLSTFIQEVAIHGESNICYAFYKEFIADMSSVFKNFLLRHSKVLENWSI